MPRILLVDDEVAGEGLASLNEGFNGLFLEIKGDAEYGRVPLLEQFRRHMGDDVAGALLIGSADTLDQAGRVIGDLFEILFHNLFFGKSTPSFGKNLAEVK